VAELDALLSASSTALSKENYDHAPGWVTRRFRHANLNQSMLKRTVALSQSLSRPKS
jgi:hypothetical protein